MFRAARARRIAIVLFFIGGGSFLTEIAWVVLSHHDIPLLRLVALITGAVAILLWQRFPRKDDAAPGEPAPMAPAPTDIVDR
jgi:hypothetical protein